MGQYHKVANLDKKQVIDAHEMGEGIKLLEFAGGRTSQALTVLLAISNGRGGGDLHSDNPIIGSWAGDRIAVIGDYWEEDEAKETGIPTWSDMDEWENISRKVLIALCEDPWLKNELLEDLKRYKWGKDWSDIFTEDELNGSREES